MTGIGCPKHMVYGPCAGVRINGGCEVDERPCVFSMLSTAVEWRGVADRNDPDGYREIPLAAPLHESARRMADLVRQRSVVIADLPARPMDADSLTRCADELRDSVDAVLLGDSPATRVQFPPSYRARLAREVGLTPWVGLNGRDRNRSALIGELAALADVGVAGIHSVTGDYGRTTGTESVSAVFDLDSSEIAALARAAGHLVSVGESPAARPVHIRSERLGEKVRAGAQLCFVNHCGAPDTVAAFIEKAHQLRIEPGFIPCVPFVIDEGSARVIRSFTNVVLPDGYIETILASSNARTAGISAAVAMCESLLRIEGVVGVNLSGGPMVGDEASYARALAEASRAVSG